MVRFRFDRMASGPFLRELLRRSALAVLACGIVLACARRDDTRSTPSQRLALAYKQIDEGQTTEAISSLESELRSGSLTREREEDLRAALASAHVKEAGLSAASFYKFARAWMDSGDNGDGFSFFAAPRSSEAQVSDAPLQIFQREGLEGLALVLQIKSRFDALPVVDASGVQSLTRALAALEPLKSPSKGVALYRGLIRTVRFKHRLIAGPFQGARLVASKCEIDASGFVDPLVSIANETALVGSDLALAFPKSAANLESFVANARGAATSLTKLAGQLRTNDKTLPFEITEVLRFVQVHLGWKWTCR